MFDIQEKSEGSKYTTIVALLVLALIFSPAVLLVSRPLGFGAICLAVGSSIAFIGLAFIVARRNSARTRRVFSGQRQG
jgi:hypothetical protein